MKNLLLFIFLIVGATSFAQKGSWYVGGSAGVESRKLKGGDALSVWRLSPEAGTFLSDNIQVGIALNISGGTKDVVEKSSGFTAYSRYFFKPGNALRPFVGLAIPYSKTTAPDFIGGEIITTRVGATVNGGFAYALSSRWTVLGSLAAISFLSEKVGEQVTQDLKIGANTLANPFNIGIYYTFLK